MHSIPAKGTVSAYVNPSYTGAYGVLRTELFIGSRTVSPYTFSTCEDGFFIFFCLIVMEGLDGRIFIPPDTRSTYS